MDRPIRVVTGGLKPLGAGRPAPDFTLPDAQGRLVNLSDYRGRWCLLIFVRHRY